MLNDTNTPYYAALQIIQQAVSLLANWADAAFSPSVSKQFVTEDVQIFLKEAQRILAWSQQEPAPLRLVFDQIRLSPSTNLSSTHLVNYRPVWALEVHDGEKTPRIPYTQVHSESEVELEALKSKIRETVDQLDPENLIQLIVFLEKFGSHLSTGESDIALSDQARATAAVAAALAQKPANQQLALIAGDLTGVQKFIYTISSDGALKSLRARSFYLELVTEEILQQLLEVLNLPRTNIIYAGASKFYILAAATDKNEQAVEQIQKQFNHWLFDEFQQKIFLAMGLVEFPASDLQPQLDPQATDTPLARHWRDVNYKLSEQSSRKFEGLLSQLLKVRNSHMPCRICHRDDKQKLRRLNNDADSIEACSTCCRMYRLGGQLLQIKAIVRSLKRPLSKKHLGFALPSGIVYYNLFDTIDQALIVAGSNTTLLVNTWDIKQYQTHSTIPLLLSNYGQKSYADPDATLPASEMTQVARGVKRVGYLRMDVDRLSQIFARGLGAKQTLPRLASLSSQMTYFFKIYLNSLAANRRDNLPKNSHQLDLIDQRPNLLFIYAGGDDLFVSGAWNEIVDFAFDVYQSFRAYTGHHPEITLSAGIYLADAKFPLYQAAVLAGRLEDDAKDNGRDSLAAFGAVFKWEKWIGRRAEDPTLLGVLPLVEALLKQELEAKISQAFVRNLLITAQQQDRLIQEKEKKIVWIRKQQPQLSETNELIEFLRQEQQEIRSYLHLPKITYTISRLPQRVQDNDSFIPIRTSLKHTKNASYFRAIATWIELLTRKSES